MVWGAIAGGVASAVAGSALGGSKKRSKNTGRAAEFSLNRNSLFDAYLNHIRGPDYVRIGAKGALKDYQNQALDSASLANQMGTDYLGSLGEFSPEEIMQMQYDIMSPVLAEQEEADRLSLENRLFAQGTLGGTAGANRMNALYDSQSEGRRRLLYDSLGLGINARNAQLGMAQGLFGIGSAGLQQVLGIQDAANQTYGTIAASQGGQAPVSGGGGIRGALGAGLINSGVGMMSQGIDRLFTNQNQGPHSGPYTSSGAPTHNGWQITGMR